MSTIAASPLPLERIRLSAVSWSYYEQTLAEIGDQRLLVTFLDGEMEIMSPLPEHDAAKRAIGRLVEMLAFLTGRPTKSFGSTTFRRKEKSAGAEPDECYYFSDINSVKGMKRFDPAVHRAPDLVVEVDLVSSSIPREPIFERLGVPELWRYTPPLLTVRSLGADGRFSDSPVSGLFPFLPITEFAGFIPRMIDEDETAVLVDFKNWVLGIAPESTR